MSLARRLMIFAAVKLPKHIQPYAGADGLKSVSPKAGAILWTTNSDSGRLEAVKIIGQHGNFDQYIIWKWQWLTGPDKEKIETGYGRGYWQVDK